MVANEVAEIGKTSSPRRRRDAEKKGIRASKDKTSSSLRIGKENLTTETRRHGETQIMSSENPTAGCTSLSDRRE